MMKRLATVSCRSGGKHILEFFHFQGLLIVWAMTISKEPRRLFSARQGERCTKGSVHPIVHPLVHLGDQEFLSVRAVRIWTKQVKKVGITYFSFVFTIFFSL
jgi:hypothetical protein